MATANTRQPSAYRYITMWIVSTLLLLQLLVVITTWHCSDSGAVRFEKQSSSSSHSFWAPTDSICKQGSDASTLHFGRSKAKLQKPYAVAFCFTSIHQLCTALINAVRLRKLQTSQVSVILLPKSIPCAICSLGCCSLSLHDVTHVFVCIVLSALNTAVNFFIFSSDISGRCCRSWHLGMHALFSLAE